MSFYIICCVHKSGKCTKLSLPINGRMALTPAGVIPAVQCAGFKFVNLAAWPPRRTTDLLAFGSDFVTFDDGDQLSMDACVPISALKGSNYVAYVM